jgi:hypothetical protein
MSDFLTELRNEVVDAHARHRRRRRLHRALRPAHPKGWSARPVLAVAAVLVALLAVVISGRFHAAPRPGSPGVSALLRVGGMPVDAAYGDGSLWVSDTGGVVIRIDPARRRVLARIPTRGNALSIAFGGGRVWVRTLNRGSGTSLVEIDPKANRVAARVPAGGDGGIAAGAGAVWSINRYPSSPEDISRISAAGHGATTHVPFLRADGIAIEGDTVWAIAHTGTVAQLDGRTGRIVHRWPQAAASDASTNSENVLAPDAHGLWVLGTEAPEIVRIQAGQITRRIALQTAVTQPVLANAADGLWVAASNHLGTSNSIVRIDPGSGHADATIELGAHHPTALVPAGHMLCVVTDDGQVLFVTP